MEKFLEILFTVGAVLAMFLGGVGIFLFISKIMFRVYKHTTEADRKRQYEYMDAAIAHGESARQYLRNHTGKEFDIWLKQNPKPEREPTPASEVLWSVVAPFLAAGVVFIMLGLFLWYIAGVVP